MCDRSGFVTLADKVADDPAGNEGPQTKTVAGNQPIDLVAALDSRQATGVTAIKWPQIRASRAPVTAGITTLVRLMTVPTMCAGGWISPAGKLPSGHRLQFIGQPGLLAYA